MAIIGAGAAGLYAADILTSQGINVFVLEARSSLGGRIRSFNFSDSQSDNSSDAFIYDYNYPPNADFPVELGADIAYGSDSAWGKIVSVLNIPTVDLSTSVSQFILDNTPKAGSDWQGDGDYSAVQNFVSGLSSYSGANQSIKDAAGVTTRAQGLLNAQAGNFYGSSADKISALGLAGELSLIPKIPHDTKQLSVKISPWQDILLSRFNDIVSKVQLNTPVTNIDYSGSQIVITDKSGKQYKADKIIVTVPVSILKNNGIVFTPALPSVNAIAATKFGMDSCVRAVIDFKTNFWGNTAGFIWGGSIVPQYFSSGFGRSIYNSTLALTVCGQAGSTLSSFGNASFGIHMINPILNELDALYPDPTGKSTGLGTKWVRRKIVNNTETDPIASIYDWSKDPYIQGGFSYPLVGATHQDRIDLATNVPGKIFFAGEATDITGDAGTVSGALNSADRATKELIKSITG